MSKSIIYGIGEAVLTDLKDPNKIIGFSKLQNLTIDMSAETDEVRGGDDPYPITEFPRTNNITITAQDALFDIDYMALSQGTITEKKASVDMTEFLNVVIPADGVIELKEAPVDGSVVIKGFEKADQPAKGKFTVEGKKITFHKDNANDSINGIYKVKRAGGAKSVAGLKGKFPKPFKFTHRIPIYNDENQIVQQMELTIFKCKSDSNFNFDLAQQQAYAPQVSLKALDPKRPDKKLWDIVLVDVEPEDGDFGTV